MTVCLFNIKREIKNVNKLVFFTYLAFCLAVMSIAHIIGGRSYIYNCLRLPLFAPARGSFLLLIFALCFLSALAVSLYMNRFNRVAGLRKIKVNFLFLSFVFLCGAWYPMFFGRQMFASALIILLTVMILGIICVKIFSKKCFVASFIMMLAEFIIIYLFFLQLCINILN